MKTTLEGAAV